MLEITRHNFICLPRRREHLHARALQSRAVLSTHIHRETGPQQPTHSFWSFLFEKTKLECGKKLPAFRQRQTHNAVRHAARSRPARNATGHRARRRGARPNRRLRSPRCRPERKHLPHATEHIYIRIYLLNIHISICLFISISIYLSIYILYLYIFLLTR